MAPQFFQYHVADHVATITFDRPDKLNAFTRAMAADLITLIDQVDADDAVRAVIITGAGRAFCAGADLNAAGNTFSGGTSTEPARDFGGVVALRLFDCLKPLIVAFNGSAAGMGVTMALAADIRLAADTARFALPFVRRGIVPESCASWFLPRIVGISQALEWTLTGRTFGAAEALAGRLVKSIHPVAEVLPAAQALAAEIASQAAPVSVALTRQMLWRMLGAEHPMQAHRIETLGVFARSKAGDVREGVASFLGKRDPHFADTVSADLPGFYPWWPERRYEDEI